MESTRRTLTTWAQSPKSTVDFKVIKLFEKISTKSPTDPSPAALLAVDVFASIYSLKRVKGSGFFKDQSLAALSKKLDKEVSMITESYKNVYLSLDAAWGEGNVFAITNDLSVVTKAIKGSLMKIVEVSELYEPGNRTVEVARRPRMIKWIETEAQNLAVYSSNIPKESRLVIHSPVAPSVSPLSPSSNAVPKPSVTVKEVVDIKVVVKENKKSAGNSQSIFSTFASCFGSDCAPTATDDRIDYTSVYTKGSNGGSTTEDPASYATESSSHSDEEPSKVGETVTSTVEKEISIIPKAETKSTNSKNSYASEQPQATPIPSAVKTPSKKVEAEAPSKKKKKKKRRGMLSRFFNPETTYQASAAEEGMGLRGSSMGSA